MPGATVRPTMRRFYLGGGGCPTLSPDTLSSAAGPLSPLKPWAQTSDLTGRGPLVVVWGAQCELCL